MNLPIITNHYLVIKFHQISNGHTVNLAGGCNDKYINKIIVLCYVSLLANLYYMHLKFGENFLPQFSCALYGTSG